MPLKIILLLLAFMTWRKHADGQAIQPPFLISNGGYIPNNSSISIHWTIGEIAVTELKGNVHLTQGFYQAYNYKTETFEYDDGHTVSFYPNPVSNDLTIEHDYPNAISLSVFDMMGRNLLDHHEILTQINLDLSGLQAGTYIIKFTNAAGKYQAKKFIKI